MGYLTCVIACCSLCFSNQELLISDYGESVLWKMHVVLYCLASITKYTVTIYSITYLQLLITQVFIGFCSTDALE